MMMKMTTRTTRRVLAVVGVMVWALICSLDITSAETPFRFLHACDPTTTTTTTNTTTAPNTTLLLFYADRTLPPSSCQCQLCSRAPMHLAWQCRRGNVSITISHSNISKTFDDDDDCHEFLETGDRVWNTSSKYPRLTITMATTAGAGREKEKSGDRQGRRGSETRNSPWKGGDYGFLVVDGQGDVHTVCSRLPPSTTHAPATTSSTEATGPESITTDTHNTTSTVRPALANSSTPTDAITTNVTTTANSAIISPSSSSSSEGEAPNTLTTPSTGTGKSGGDGEGGNSRSSNNHQRIGSQDDDDDDDAGDFTTGVLPYLALGGGLLLMVVALALIIVNVVKQRRRFPTLIQTHALCLSRKKSVDVEKTAASQNPAAPAATTSQGNPTKVHTATEGSRQSLLNDNHNYEEVSDDGLGAVAGRPPAPTSRKISNLSLPASTYSHIKANHAPATQSRRNTTPATVPEADDDDYNHLNLAQAGRLTSPEAKASSAPIPFFASEDDEYMDVNDDGDDAGSDIYEAVDGDLDRTPLCPRRGGESDEYTNCQSGEDGKIHIYDNTAGQGSRVKNLHLSAPASRANGETRPSLPTSPPPTAGKGLSRHNSRSLNNLHARQKFQGKGQHQHSKSLDLNRHSLELGQQALCQQRDLFLQRFRSQGDRAESVDSDSPPVEDDYSEVQISYPGHDSLTSNLPGTSPDAAAQASQTSNANSPKVSEHPGMEADQVLMRRKSRNSKKKAAVGGDGPMSMVDHLKELNTELLELETAVRYSMEIKEDELVMMDNVLYGTLPRDLSLPTTEL